MGMTKATEWMFTGDLWSAQDMKDCGYLTRVVPKAKLEEETEKLAARIANIDTMLISGNKRSLHRAYEIAGMYNAMITGAELTGLAVSTCPSAMTYVEKVATKGLKATLEERDRPFGDYSAAKSKKK